MIRATIAAALIALGHAAATGPAAGEATLTAHQQRARALLRELVEIDTSPAHGTTRAAEALARHFEAASFPGSWAILGPTPERGNLVVRYPGDGSGGKPLLLVAHLDVVAADPADWSVPPFRFLERDGYFYGRGSVDDKDEAAIHVANLLRLAEEGYRPRRDIVLALTADEEGGEHNGVEFLLASERARIDAAFALNEGGGGALRDGHPISNAVQASEKVYQSFSLEVTSPGGHSSLPTGDNAIYRLADALRAVRDYRFPVSLNPVTRSFFARSAGLEEGALAAAMRGVLETPPDAASVAVLDARPAYAARLRTTCVATLVDAGHAENALPQRARAVVNCRILPGEPPKGVLATLRRVVGDVQVVISPLEPAIASPPSPLTPEVLAPIERITGALWPGVPVIPTMSTGATDSLFLRNAGIPVYGVSGVFSEVDDVRAHGRDERIRARSFYDGLEFLYRLVVALAGDANAQSSPE